MTATIYHNPACGTSRNVLALIRNSGEEPDVIEILEEVGKLLGQGDELGAIWRRLPILGRPLWRASAAPQAI